jgi:hypothetical protein
MRKLMVAAALAGMLGLAACADMSATEQRTLSGAGIGAAGGAVIGALAGSTLWGAAIGTAAGAAGGYIWDMHKQAESSAYQQGFTAGKAAGTSQ